MNIIIKILMTYRLNIIYYRLNKIRYKSLMNILMNDFNIYSENKTALFLCRGDLGSTPMRLDGTSNLF